MSFNPAQVIESLHDGIAYIPQTLAIVAIAFVISFVLGLGIAIILVRRVPVLNGFFKGFIAVMKGIPVYLLLIFAYLVFTTYFDRFAAAVGLPWTQKDVNGGVFGGVILSVAFIPFMAEALRGAFLAVPEGQYEAGRSVGLTGAQILRRIVIPQMIPEALPNLTNDVIGLIKGSALLYMIGVMDILNASLKTANVSYSIFEGYLAAALIYWALCFIVERSMGWLTRRTGRFKAVLVV